MRSLLLLSLATSSLVACTATATSTPDMSSASVRDRLSKDARLWIAPSELAGAITAEKRESGAWSGSTVDLGIENGELVLSADQDTVTVEGFQLSFAPMQLPQGLFGGQTAELTDVRFDLPNSSRSPARWTDNNTASFTAMLELEIHWTLSLDGAPAPLGSPKLPPVPVDVTLGGDGDSIEATMSLHAGGELWNWAGLVKLSELQLSVDATL
ncbi:MAG: hypothetical protein SFX73_21865 [Kofleriaceae bacterium]|nr:hypothetical protein [Kofleriaceae bacterium]